MKKPPRWAAVEALKFSDHVYAVFAVWSFLREEVDHFLWRAGCRLRRIVLLRRLEIDNGMEERHGDSFQVVKVEICIFMRY